MSNRRIAFLLALGLVAAHIGVACAPAAPAAPPPHVDGPPAMATPPAASVTDAPTTPPPAEPAAASVAPTAPPAPAASEAPPPCIDGEIMMGACICARGKGVDATGHCVFMPCPKGSMGGTVFRDETGQCMECRPGTRPSSDGKCSR